MKTWYEMKSGQHAKSEGQINIVVTQIKTVESNTISNELSGELSPNIEPIKIPWFTAISLSFLIVASLVTGVFYWYTVYYNPEEYYVPVMHTFQTPNPTPNDHENNHLINTAPGDELENELPTPTEPPRPEMDPLPEFVELWEEYDNRGIVGRLIIADADVLVLQKEGNDIAGEDRGYFVLLDSGVDLLIGEEHNMVVYVYGENPIRQTLQAYFDYGFFLENPTITFSTMYGEFDWEIFSFYVAPAAFPFMTVNHESDEIWGEVVEQFTLASLYNTRLDVTMYDQILTLTAQTDAHPDLYYVLQARMLRHITS
ncbi:MAG: hypothetical protein FWD90_06275 [Defluviitaleaceae bacterium]|nr:hypothetical protein [Defluviitaleaceae bacterium]